MDKKSKKWVRPTILLCSYGFFSYIKPSEPFITPFLMAPPKNMTQEEIVNHVFPVWSYSYTAFLVPIFLLTDYLRYKPIVMLQGLGYIGCWLLLVFSMGVPMMQLMQVSYGLATACQIGYYAYIYSIVEPEYYQKATSYVRTSTQFGLFIGSVLSQILVSVAHIDYIYLNVMSLINVSIAFVIACFLPIPKSTLYFFRKSQHMVKHEEEVACSQAVDADLGVCEKTAADTPTERMVEIEATTPTSKVSQWKNAFAKLWHDVEDCYSDPQLLRWSVWWALSTCGWILVVNYIQNLWETIYPSQDNESHVYNGAVESAAQIFGALAALSVGYLKVDWKMWGEIFLGFGSIIKCGLLVVMYLTDTIWVCYIAYVVFMGLYNFVITISQFRIAVGLSTERFALVFGVNTFFAVMLNTILTVIIVDDAVLGLDVSTQFVVYSGYFGLIAVVYLGHGFSAFFKKKRSEEVPCEDTVPRRSPTSFLILLRPCCEGGCDLWPDSI